MLRPAGSGAGERWAPGAGNSVPSLAAAGVSRPGGPPAALAERARLGARRIPERPGDAGGRTGRVALRGAVGPERDERAADSPLPVYGGDAGNRVVVADALGQ